MIALVWRFEVRDEERAAFEAAYGPGGDWARLFARSGGFRGSELLRNADGSYLTIDVWRTRADFDAFLADHGPAYEALDAETERLTRCEHRIGEYEVVA